MKKIASFLIRNNIIEHILFAVLGLFAILLFEERLLADSSYYIFRVINNESFWVEHNRFILVFSQILPLIGVKLGFDLKTVLYLYSIGHVVFFYIIFLVTRYYYKSKEAGVFLLLLQTMGIMSGFFVPMFELYYCAGLLVLFSTILYYSNKKIDIAILIVLALLILTGHPYTSILLVLILVLHAIQYKNEYLWSYAVFLFIIIVVFVFKKYTASEYEQGKANAFISNLFNADYNFQYFKLLSGFMFRYYKELLFMELITIIYLLFSKNYLKLTLVVLAFIGTLVMVNISYFGFGHSRYQEQVYFSLSFVVAYPFVIYLVKNKKLGFMISFLTLSYIIIIIRLFVIWGDRGYYTARVAQIKDNISTVRINEYSKFIINQDSLTYNPNWSYPIETLLMSSYDNGSSITICTQEDMDYKDNKTEIRPSQYMFRRWEIYELSRLNSNYFKLDNGDYIKIIAK